MRAALEGVFSGQIVDLAGGRTFSSRAIANEASARATTLERQGIGRGDIVLIAHANSPAAVFDLLAAWSVGAAAACLAPTLTLPELQNLARFAVPAAILAGQEFAFQKAAFPMPVLSLGNAPEGAPAADEFPLRASDPALILFTSGTTGTPKGVVHTRRSLEAKIGANLDLVGGAAFERSLCVLSTNFVAGLLSNVLTPLAAGKTIYLFPNPGIRGAARIGAIVDQHRITMVNTVPSFWNMVLKASPPPRGRSLTFVACASAPLKRETWQRVMAWCGTANVWNMYGTTETGGWNVGIAGANLRGGAAPAGACLSGRMAVLDEAGKIRSEGDGEVLLKTPSLMAGYLNRPDLTAQASVRGWFRTGDLGCIDGARLLTVKGRASAQINRAGVKVIPDEVESLLESHGEVREACVFALPDAISGETVAAAIVLEAGSRLDSGALREWCRERIRQECIPEQWFRLAALPRTATGKLNRKKTEEECRDQRR